jgi:hypothetical protein
MPDDIGHGRDDQARDQIHAAFAAGAPVVIADFTTTAFCDCAVLQRMLAVRSYVPPAALSSAWWSRLPDRCAGYSRAPGWSSNSSSTPTACHAAPARLTSPPRGSARLKSGRSGHCSRQRKGFTERSARCMRQRGI